MAPEISNSTNGSFDNKHGKVSPENPIAKPASATSRLLALLKGSRLDRPVTKVEVKPENIPSNLGFKDGIGTSGEIFPENTTDTFFRIKTKEDEAEFEADVNKVIFAVLHPNSSREELQQADNLMLFVRARLNRSPEFKSSWYAKQEERKAALDSEAKGIQVGSLTPEKVKLLSINEVENKILDYRLNLQSLADQIKERIPKAKSRFKSTT